MTERETPITPDDPDIPDEAPPPGDRDNDGIPDPLDLLSNLLGRSGLGALRHRLG